MRWNWQQADWPTFRWEEKVFVKAEAAFLGVAESYSCTAL
jgi:hypothetical protein